jgi:SAM-dependent methyltransferase
VPRATCDTTFPRELIELLLASTAPEWICDAIARHEDPAYIEDELRSQLLAYFPLGYYEGRRILDFGCGNGASTLAMAALLPHAEVVGVELSRDKLTEAGAILRHRNAGNARFLQSPSGDSLPADIGEFDVVMLSAVFEHLLPQERRTVMPLIWSHLRCGGVMFINQTPHRWHPFEHHSTGLWGINYLPDRVAWRVAARYGRGTKHRTWDAMLRGGIRGGTERSIRTALTAGRLDEAEVLAPAQNGLRTRADHWLSRTSPRHSGIKRAIAAAFRVMDATAGTMPTLNVSVAIRKRC